MSNYEFRGTLKGLSGLYLRYMYLVIAGLPLIVLPLVPAVLNIFFHRYYNSLDIEDHLRAYLRAANDLGGEAVMILAFLLPWLLGMILMGFASRAAWKIKLFKIHNTFVFDAPLGLEKIGCGARFNLFLWFSIAVPLSAGLLLPWAYTRSVFYKYATLVVPSRPGHRLRFDGSGWGMLGLLLLMPLAVALAPFTLMVSWAFWIALRRRWEMGHVLIPSAGGDYHRLRYSGSIEADIGLWMKNFYLTLLTLGIYAPAARIRTWKRVAEACEVL